MEGKKKRKEKVTKCQGAQTDRPFLRNVPHDQICLFLALQPTSISLQFAPLPSHHSFALDSLHATRGVPSMGFPPFSWRKNPRGRV